MRKSFLIITAVLFTIFRSGAQVPEWVTTHPVSDDAYIGIGQASLTEDDYMRIATENALSDIATQIATKVESNSFFHQVDVDGHAREMFEDRINSNATAWLEGHELKESHTSGNTYYVYYTLDKKTFRRNAEKKREAAIATGLDYLEKGKAAERAMNLTQAAVLYGEGLKAVEPWMFMDLIRDGVNIPVELYDSYINEFILGKKRIFAAPELMGQDLWGNPVFDPSDVVFYQLPEGYLKEGGKPLETVDMNLRADEHEKAINDNLNMLSMKCGFGQNHYKFENGSVQTATQVISENSDMYRTINKHELILEPVLDELIRIIARLGQILGINTNPDTEIVINFDDSIIEDKQAERQSDRQDVGMGVMSHAEYRAKWYGEALEVAQSKLPEQNQVME